MYTQSTKLKQLYKQHQAITDKHGWNESKYPADALAIAKEWEAEVDAAQEHICFKSNCKFCTDLRKACPSLDWKETVNLLQLCKFVLKANNEPDEWLFEILADAVENDTDFSFDQHLLADYSEFLCHLYSEEDLRGLELKAEDGQVIFSTKNGWETEDTSLRNGVAWAFLLPMIGYQRAKMEKLETAS